MPFAENLRHLRLERFLTQAELARRATLHTLTITRLEAGSTAPSARTVRALAEVLDVEPHDLATPGEVADLRRVLQGGGRAANERRQRLERWGDDGGAQPVEPATAERQHVGTSHQGRSQSG